MGKFNIGQLPLVVGIGLSTLAVLGVIELVLTCLEAPTLPPIHCGMRTVNAIRALWIYLGHYLWHSLVVLLAVIFLLRGVFRKWALALWIPIVIFILGINLSENVFKLDCKRKTYGEGPMGTCY
ncbi:MAG: hypothetical protein J0M12_16935 [Deltaproteobacteria bacterium]|nr:hypothetical protein [Deltaproteobacteria bacterium]